MTDHLASTDELVSLSAELVAEPVPDPHERVFDLRWEITTALGRSSDAGVAVLRIPHSDLVAEFDYSRPEHLLRLIVPFGTAVVDDRLEDDPVLQLISAGRFAKVDRSVLELMFESTTIDRFEHANVVDQHVAVTPAWTTLGRIAMAQTSLARRGIRLDGLWALEVGTLVEKLGDPRLQHWSNAMFRAATPALRFIDTTWLDWLSKSSCSALERLFARARDSGVQGLGPLAEELQRRAEEGVLQAASDIAEIESREIEFERDEHARTMSGGGEFDPPITVGNRQREPVDSLPRSRRPVITRTWKPEVAPANICADAAEFGLGTTTFRSTDRIVRLDGEVTRGFPAELAARVMIRITNDVGDLVAASSGMHVDGARLTAELVLPYEIATSDLTVVIGRDLPFSPIPHAAFEQRESEVARQTSIDSQRAAGQLSAIESYISEQPAQDFQGEFSLDVPDDPDQLTAARSAALIVNDVAAAAEFESRRQVLAERLNELSIPELDRLAQAAAVAGRTKTSGLLARAATTLFVTEM